MLLLYLLVIKKILGRLENFFSTNCYLICERKFQEILVEPDEF